MTPPPGLGLRAVSGALSPFPLLSPCAFFLAPLSPYLFSFLLFTPPLLLSFHNFHPSNLPSLVGAKPNLLLRPPVTNCPQFCGPWHHKHWQRCLLVQGSLTAQPAHSCQEPPSLSPASHGSQQANGSMVSGHPAGYLGLIQL